MRKGCTKEPQFIVHLCAHWLPLSTPPLVLLQFHALSSMLPCTHTAHQCVEKLPHAVQFALS